jgi:hypothetical protein
MINNEIQPSQAEININARIAKLYQALYRDSDVGEGSWYTTTVDLSGGRGVSGWVAAGYIKGEIKGLETALELLVFYR